MIGTKIFGLEDSVRIAKNTVSNFIYTKILNSDNIMFLYRSVFIVVLMELVLDVLHGTASQVYIIVVLYKLVGF